MKNNIVFVETTDGFPVKFTANNSKVKLLAKGLNGTGDKVCIINKIQGSDFVKGKFVSGIDEDVKYYTFGKYNRTPVGLFKNFVLQCTILKKLRTRDRNNIIIMGQPYFPIFVIETLFYKLLGYKVGVTKTEWPSKIKSIKGLKKIDYWLSDNFFGYFVNEIYPISSCIENLCRRFKKPIFRIPILANFPIQIKTKSTTEHYFFFCSTLAYKNNIKLVIDAFCSFLERNPSSCYSLKLILSGSNLDMTEVYKYIECTNYSEKFCIFNQIPYEELMKLYQNADGLLIPLQDTFQDRARFSQKIAEYLSTGNPIITNAVGDILYYFKNEENAFIAKSYNVDSYVEMMERIALNPELAKGVGYNGYVTGRKNFDNIVFCKKLSQYLEKS